MPLSCRAGTTTTTKFDKYIYFYTEKRNFRANCKYINLSSWARFKAQEYLHAFAIYYR